MEHSESDSCSIDGLGGFMQMQKSFLCIAQGPLGVGISVLKISSPY